MLFTLRVLSGEMSGSELLLSAKRYLIKTSNQAQDSSTTSDDESVINLFIPIGNATNDYYLDLRDPEDKTSEENTSQYYNLTDAASADSEKPRPAAFNEIEQIDNLIIAIKKQSDQWSDAVLQYIPPEKEAALTAEQEELTPKSRFKKFRFITATVVVICALAGITTWFNNTNSEQKIKKSLTDTIAGSVNPVSIIKGNQNTYYLLALTQRDFDWILQALQKNPRPDDEKIEVILLSEEPEQLTNRFWDKDYPVLTIDFSAPISPVVKVVTESELSPDKLKEIKDLSLQWIPFARTPVIKTYNKNTIISQAEDRLKLIYLPFAKLTTSQGTTFSIRGELSDNELFQLNHFIAAYKKEWGSRYINFDIQLENNLLKGKSYFNGEKGYVLMGKSHWYFPST